MMYRLFMWIAFLQMFLCKSFAQNGFLCSEEITYHIEFQDSSGILKVVTSNDSFMGRYLHATKISLLDADLQIDFQSQAQLEGFEYRFDIYLKRYEQWSISPSHLDFRGDIIVPTGKSGVLIWRDFFEDHGSLIEKYELVVKVDLFGKTHVRCDENLTHPFSRTAERVVLITGLTAGVGLLGAGQISRISANRNQRSYRDKWLSGESFSDAQELNLLAQNQKKNYEILTIVGGATLIASGIYWWTRDRHFRKDKKEFEKYCDCQKLIVFEPFMETNSLSDFATIGLTMKMNIR